MIEKISALKSLRPGAQWVLLGDELNWLDEETLAPTEEEIQDEILRLQAEEDAKKQTAQAKLAKLGLTPDDLKALLG